MKFWRGNTTSASPNRHTPYRGTRSHFISVQYKRVRRVGYSKPLYLQAYIPALSVLKLSEVAHFISTLGYLCRYIRLIFRGVMPLLSSYFETAFSTWDKTAGKWKGLFRTILVNHNGRQTDRQTRQDSGRTEIKRHGFKYLLNGTGGTEGTTATLAEEDGLNMKSINKFCFLIGSNFFRLMTWLIYRNTLKWKNWRMENWKINWMEIVRSQWTWTWT